MFVSIKASQRRQSCIGYKFLMFQIHGIVFHDSIFYHNFTVYSLITSRWFIIFVLGCISSFSFIFFYGSNWFLWKIIEISPWFKFDFFSSTLFCDWINNNNRSILSNFQIHFRKRYNFCITDILVLPSIKLKLVFICKISSFLYWKLRWYRRQKIMLWINSNFYLLTICIFH